MNPALMDKEVVARMCEKSKRLSGAKWKWRRICEKHGLTVEQVEEKFDIIIKRQEEAIEKRRRASNKQLGNDAGRSVGDGAGEEEVSATGDSGDTKGSDRGESGAITESGGQKVRSGETENGSSTTEGSE